MSEDLAGFGAGIRDVIGAWIACLAFAVGCFSLLAIAPGHARRPPEGLISFDPAATVLLAKAEPHGRC